MTVTQEQADAIYLEAIGIENDKDRLNHIVRLVQERNALTAAVDGLRGLLSAQVKANVSLAREVVETQFLAAGWKRAAKRYRHWTRQNAQDILRHAQAATNLREERDELGHEVLRLRALLAHAVEAIANHNGGDALAEEIWSAAQPAALAAAGPRGEGADGTPQAVVGGAPVRFDAGLDDAAYLEMLAEERHEANFRAAHGLPPADTAAGPHGEQP
jgi:hypothetical protein